MDLCISTVAVDLETWDPLIDFFSESQSRLQSFLQIAAGDGRQVRKSGPRASSLGLVLTHAETTTQLSTARHHIENITMVRTSLCPRACAAGGVGTWGAALRRPDATCDTSLPVYTRTSSPRVAWRLLQTAHGSDTALRSASPFSSAPRGTAERIAAQLSVARVWVEGAPALPD